MKRKLAAWMILASAILLPVAYGADEDHAAHHPNADQNQAPLAQDDKAVEMKMEKMQEQMEKMQEQMEKIHSSKDPQERQKLMKEHMQSMQQGMKMMGGMGAGMKGGDMMAKAKKDQSESMSDAGDGVGMCMMMMKKHKSVEARLNMMQKMMEQMMEHEGAEQEMERGR